MRQKDAETVARILGIELRTCPQDEQTGLIAAIGAIGGHMQHAYPDFDVRAYRRAVEREVGEFASRIDWETLA